MLFALLACILTPGCSQQERVARERQTAEADRLRMVLADRAASLQAAHENNRALLEQLNDGEIEHQRLRSELEAALNGMERQDSLRCLGVGQIPARCFE